MKENDEDLVKSDESAPELDDKKKVTVFKIEVC
jgi:hypothetical protein